MIKPISIMDHLSRCNMNRGVANMKTFIPRELKAAEKNGATGCQVMRDLYDSGNQGYRDMVKVAKDRVKEGWFF